VSPGEVARSILLSAAVFAPVAGVSAALGYLVIRRRGKAERARLLVWTVASVGLGGLATAMLWTGPQTTALLVRLVISLGSILVAYLIVALATRWLHKHIEDPASRIKFRKALVYALTAVVILVLLKIWVLRQQINYTTVFSILGAGLALALHQVIMCFTGWLVLLVHRYYDVGDRVQIGEVRGDVSDIGILHTTLVEIGEWVAADQSTGRLVTVPNSAIFAKSVFNYTRGFRYIWNEISILVTFESNWRKAQQMMLEVAQPGVEEIEKDFREQIKHISRKYMILYQHLTPIVYPSIRDCGVLLTLRYLTKPKERRGTEAALTAKILDAFAAEPDVEFAYPTTRFYDATREGKLPAKPSE